MPKQSSGYPRSVRAVTAGRRSQPADGKRTPSASGGVAIDADTARIAANKYMLFRYPLGVLGGTPRRVSLSDTELWVVPVLLTTPRTGPVGEIGMVAVNARTGEVVGATPKDDVAAAGQRVLEEKRDQVNAALLQTRAR